MSATNEMLRALPSSVLFIDRDNCFDVELLSLSDFRLKLLICHYLISLQWTTFVGHRVEKLHLLDVPYPKHFLEMIENKKGNRNGTIGWMALLGLTLEG